MLLNISFNKTVIKQPKNETLRLQSGTVKNVNFYCISWLQRLRTEVRNKKPPAMRVRVGCYTKNTPKQYNKNVQDLENYERRILMANSTKFITHKMVIQVPYSNSSKVQNENNIQSITSFSKHTTQNERIKFYGLSER